MTDIHNTDSYKTIASPAQTEIKIQGSRFLGFAYPVETVEEFDAQLEALKKEHYNATHHCYAYKMGLDGKVFRYNDDGEPNGTAGKRIFGAIEQAELTDVGIVVVRYFGGTKLGVGGLGRAYSDSAQDVLGACKVVRRYLKTSLHIDFPFDVTSEVHRTIEAHSGEIDDRQYAESTVYTVRIRDSFLERFLEELRLNTERKAHVDIVPNNE